VTPDRQERMEFAWIGPRLSPLERKRLGVALDLLAGRVRRRLVIAEGLASGLSAAASGIGPVQLSLITVFLSASSNAYRVEGVLRSELERLHRDGAGEAEVAESRARASAEVIFGLEDIQRRAAGLAEDPPIEPVEELRELRAIDAASVLAAARRYLVSQHRLVAYTKYDQDAPRGGEVVMEEVTP